MNEEIVGQSFSNEEAGIIIPILENRIKLYINEHGENYVSEYDPENYVEQVTTIIQKLKSPYECEYNSLELARIHGCAIELLESKQNLNTTGFELKYYNCICDRIMYKCKNGRPII